MGRLRNQRHELFVRAYLKHDFNGAEAYRAIYPRHQAGSARNSASRLLASASVKRRLNEVQTAMLKRADITVDSILNEYEEARLLAQAQSKPEAMGALSERKAKLVGLLIDRRETGQAGEFEQLTDIGEILEKVRQEAGIEAAEALAKAFHIDPPAPHAGDALEDQDLLGTLKPPTGAVN